MKHGYKIATAAVIALVIGGVSLVYPKVKPFIAAIYLVKADNTYKTGDLDKALSKLKIALWFDPTYALAYSHRAQIYLEKGLPSKALSDAARAIDLLPMNGRVYCTRGYIYEQIGDYSNALRDFKKGVEVAHPKIRAEMLNCLAWFQATCPSVQYRDGVAAVENAKLACQLTGWRDSTLLDTLAVAYAESGDFTNAIQWGTKALELSAGETQHEIQSHLMLFKQGKAYHQEAKHAEQTDGADRM